MQTIGRVSAFALVGLFVINVFWGLIHALLPHQAVRAEAPNLATMQSGSPISHRRVIDLGMALSGPVKFFSDRILLSVQMTQLVRTRSEVRLDLIVTPRAVERYTVLRIDELAVDAARSAIVTTDGSWFQIRDADGAGLLNAAEVVRQSPVYVMDVPRQVNLGFPIPSSVVGEVKLLVRWAPGRSGIYADGWRTDRIVEVTLPPPREDGTMVSR